MTDDKDTRLSDVVKKVVSIGVGAAFMTEDAVRTVLKDLPLPKDVVNGLIQNAKGAKEDFSTAIQQELRRYLSKVDPYRLMDDFADRYDVEVNATFKFKKKKDRQTPSEGGTEESS